MGEATAPGEGPVLTELGPATVRLLVRLQPRASRDRVVGAQGEALKVAVSAPPVDGAANAALIAVLAAWLRLPKSCVEIVRGETARTKTVHLTGRPAGEIVARARAALADLR